uniref:Uncharacterized protein n=1 Tax=Spongospora subterranea TaxID=70186 RepID=A0A0H5QRQ2_9EUKA|eukprot:CRZ04221.1 hypothetical protein [Spongospora subterranea]
MQFKLSPSLNKTLDIITKIFTALRLRLFNIGTKQHSSNVVDTNISGEADKNTDSSSFSVICIHTVSLIVENAGEQLPVKSRELLHYVQAFKVFFQKLKSIYICLEGIMTSLSNLYDTVPYLEGI